ncbi:MAG: flagellin [Enterobacterales bacterium]|nr:flagellin [Enterobacterales bacterium]
MGSVIQTNVASIGAQRSLSKTNNDLSTTFQRLSTGLRINSAKDDAAGLQISNSLTSQINGLGVAVRNANDGISLAQTAEGALQETTNILQRMRDLSIQSANGSNDANSRAALQAEVAQLQSEINRIADTTSFGGRSLLDGTFGSSAFQVGSKAFQTIDVTLNSSRGADIGNNTDELTSASPDSGIGLGEVLSSASTAAANNVAGTLVVAGSAGTSSSINVAGLSAKAIADRINLQESTTNVTADARNVIGLSSLGDGNVAFDLNGSNTTAVTITAGISGSSLTALSNAINDVSASTGISATIDSSVLKLTSERGDDIVIEGFTTTATDTTATVSSYNYDGTSLTTSTQQITNGGSDSVRNIGVIKLSSSKSFTSTSSSTSVNAANAQVSTLVSVDSIDISNVIGSQNAIDIIDSAIQNIDSNRATLGAVQNRLTSTVSNLGNIIENVSAARSRIRDTDFASETANLAKNQVLQQAGLSILAQANASSQSVLSLLQ